MTLADIKIIPLLDTLRLQKISDEEYFSARFGNYISNSRLGLINPDQDGSPEKFFRGFKPIYSSSLDIGSVVHCMCLQKELFNIVDSVDKPTGKMGAMAEELFKVWKGHIPTSEDILEVAKKIDYYKGKLSPARIEEVKEKCKDFWIAKKRYLQTREETSKTDLYLDPKSRQTAYACITAIENNTSIQNILHPTPFLEGLEKPISEMEQAILLDVKVEIPDTQPFILRLKAKLDNYIIDKDRNEIQVNDIKTTFDLVSNFQVAIDKFHYHREIAIYSWLLSLCAEKFYGLKKPIIKSNFLVVQTKPNFYTKIIPMTKALFIKGFNEFKFLLRLVAYHVNKDHKDFAEWIS